MLFLTKSRRAQGMLFLWSFIFKCVEHGTGHVIKLNLVGSGQCAISHEFELNSKL